MKKKLIVCSLIFFVGFLYANEKSVWVTKEDINLKEFILDEDGVTRIETEKFELRDDYILIIRPIETVENDYICRSSQIYLLKDDSIRDNVEIASYIRKKGSYYFYDVPHGGTTEGVTSDRKMSEVDIVASIHTHAAYNSRIKELPGGVYTRTSLVPSFWDVKSVKETGLPLYTVTPDGTMFLTEKDIESEAGVIHYIFDADFPSDPNCHVRKNLLDANTMSDNDYISQDEYKRRKDQR